MEPLDCQAKAVLADSLPSGSTYLGTSSILRVASQSALAAGAPGVGLNSRWKGKRTSLSAQTAPFPRAFLEGNLPLIKSPILAESGARKCSL